MHRLTRRAFTTLMFALPAACGDRRDRRAQPAGSAAVARLIARYSDQYGVPEDLVHRIVRAESGYNPEARNGPYYGLMQILADTARTMGYRGEPEGLLDADTNLRYGVKYLRGAWIVSGRDRDRAEMWYRKGYYYEAKRKGLLRETGLSA